MRRPRWREGDVYEIALAGDRWAYAVLMKGPIFGFFGGAHRDRPVDFGAVEFYAMVHYDALARWTRVARLPVSGTPNPWFFKQDALSKELRLRNAESGEEVPATPEDVMRHEPAWIWDPEEIEIRLNGDRTAKVEQMRAFVIKAASRSTY